MNTILAQEESSLAKKSITQDPSSHLVAVPIEVKTLSITSHIRDGKAELL